MFSKLLTLFYSKHLTTSMRLPCNDLPLVPVGEKQCCPIPNNSKEIIHTNNDESATLLPIESEVKRATIHSEMNNPVISIQTSYATINLNDKCPQELMINLLKSLKEIN